MSRYTKYPQGIDQKLPVPASMKNDIVLTPNHEALHANSSKQPFSLSVDSRDRNIELYPNANSYVIQTPRYKDVLSVELIAGDVPHSGYNIDNSNNIIYMIFTQDMFRQYYNGVRENGVSYIEAFIPSGNYELSDLISVSNTATSLGTNSTVKSFLYQSYYDIDGPNTYVANTGTITTAMYFAVQKYAETLDDSDPDKANYLLIDFFSLYDLKTLKIILGSNAKFAIVNRDTDKNVNNQPIPNFFINQTSAQAGDSFLGVNNDRFTGLPNSAYNILGFNLKNYFPVIYEYQIVTYIPNVGENSYWEISVIDGMFDKTDPDYVQTSKGYDYYYPPLYPVGMGSNQYSNNYNPNNPCDLSLTGLDSNVTILSTWQLVPGTEYSIYQDYGSNSGFCVYSLPNRPNLNGEKYIILDIPELNYRDLTSTKNNQFYCRILFDTSINVTALTNYYNSDKYPAVSNLATNNTVKSVKGSDIGNNRCIKYFTPTLGVLSKLTIRWLKYDGTPYDFQGQDHAIHMEVLTVKQTGTYYS